jgi:hypothetical protein
MKYIKYNKEMFLSHISNEWDDRMILKERNGQKNSEALPMLTKVKLR